MEGTGENVAKDTQFFSTLLSRFYVWVHLGHLGNEHIKPIQDSVGMKSRTDGAKLLSADHKTST